MGSVRYVHTILHRMFKDAVRWGRLARNPTEAADPPRAAATGSLEIAPWSVEELRTFLREAQGDRALRGLCAAGDHRHAAG